MPTPRKRKSAAAQPPEEEEEEVQPEGSGGLKFNEPLTWRAGRPIAVADLLRRLQALSKELQELEQEEVEREALVQPAKELATHNLLEHKDRGVRAWTACCLVDIFRLCAPDAPYTATQLKVSRTFAPT
jgi:sister chromatid cohesion protein PDS5